MLKCVSAPAEKLVGAKHKMRRLLLPVLVALCSILCIRFHHLFISENDLLFSVCLFFKAVGNLIIQQYEAGRES